MQSQLLNEYNHTRNVYPTAINIDEISEIRSSGNYNPAPLFLQTTDRGNAFQNVNKNMKDKLLEPVAGNLELSHSNAVQLENTWNTNSSYYLNASINGNGNGNRNNNGKQVNSSEVDDSTFYDNYQLWAYNTLRTQDPYLLPYLFSKINVKFIQKSVKKYIKENRNIDINTEQDTEELLQIMADIYRLYYSSNGIVGVDKNVKYSYQDSNGNIKNILANLNKHIMEKYVSTALSSINMYEYYMNDISKLPTPLSLPTNSNSKGSNELGFIGHFEDNHTFNQNLISYNARNTMPGNLNFSTFGN